ncbi:piggyBac transposable element-derived protein 4 [Aplysia californica]|uniref:PiggyBac transposable element-derived protein 4 n=1 Tax=Aplysia californica TaxID=6500 RepID=A0ABM0K7Y4_APLCA|nr:piggyBac transposable element-derived protein 4 [Aplysia californica]
MDISSSGSEYSESEDSSGDHDSNREANVDLNNKLLKQNNQSGGGKGVWTETVTDGGGGGAVNGIWTRIYGEDTGPDPLQSIGVLGPKHTRPADEEPITWTPHEYATIRKQNSVGLLEEIPITDEEDVRGYFDTFVSDDIFQLFATETNSYATQVKAHKPDCYYLKDWKDTTVDEMGIMVALLIAMGLVSKPEITSYWTKHPMMPRDHFLTLTAFWHLANNEEKPQQNTPEYDKLFKLRRLFSHLNNKFSSVYCPEKELAVDESLMPWKGRVSFRQYRPSKPIKYGLKLYCCCEASSGYIVNMPFYTGAGTTGPETGHGSKALGM